MVTHEQWMSDTPGLENLCRHEDSPPTPQDGELALRVAAVGLNFSDLLMIDDRYQVRPDRPFVPGQELAGVVTAAGHGCRFAVGDRIVSKVMWGAFAGRAIVEDRMAIVVPDDVTLKEACAVPVSLTTAVVALTESTELRADETILVHAGAGALGQATIVVARAIGATVIATAGTLDKCNAAVASGAGHVINYNETNFLDEVKALTDGKGVDVVMDSVGGEVGMDSLKCLAWRGRLLVAGFASGTVQALPAHRLLLKGASAIGVYWNHDVDLAMVRRVETKMVDWWRDGFLRQRIDHREGFDAIPDALSDLASRRTIGKVVVSLGREDV